MSSPLLWFGSAAKFLKSQLIIPGSTSGNITIQPAAVTTSHALTLPGAQGAASTVMQNDGSGVLSWVSGPSVAAQMTDWALDTSFTLSAGFGSPTNVSIYSRRVGDSLEVRGTFGWTGAASVLYIQLGGGKTIDTAKMPSTTNGTFVGKAHCYDSGNQIESSGVGHALFYDGSTNNQVFLTRVSGTTTTYAKANGNTFVATTIESFFFSVPISGWSSTTVAINSISARYFASATAISGTLATINWTTKDYDTNNAMSSGTYTIPVAGKYQINTALLITGTIALNNSLVLEIQKNGTVVSRFTEFFPATLTDGKAVLSDIINCAASDTIRIQASSNVTAPSIVSSNFDNYFSIALVGN